MRKSKIGNRLVFVLVLFFFMFFHQIDVVLLNPLSAQISRSFNVNLDDIFLDPVNTLGLVVGILFALVWGYNYDRHTRKYLLSIAGFLWGATSWMMGIAPTFATYFISNAASGIDNVSYSGIYALVGDFFNPRSRGKVLGLLYLTQPMAYFFLTLLNLLLGDVVNWRMLLLVMGGIGFLMSGMVYFFIREPKRGACEPALRDIQMTGVYLFDWDIAKTYLIKPSLLLLYAFGLFGVMPWFVMSSRLFTYLVIVHNIPPVDSYLNLVPGLIAYILGLPISGLLGDMLFKRMKRGRIVVSMAGVIFPALLLCLAFMVTDAQGNLFVLLMMLMGFFMSFTWPNIIASILDTALPELRASASSILLLFQSLGALLGPWLVSILQKGLGLGNAMLAVCLGAWGICLLLQFGLLIHIPKNIEELRQHMAYRSHLEARLQSSEAE